nr:hypothetical protein [Haliangium ochraceum]
MTLAEQDELVEALALDGANEALGVGVEVGAAWRQADRLDPAGREELAEGSGVERVAVHDEVPLAEEKAVVGVEEVPGDLQHRGTVRLAHDAGDLDAARVEFDDEEDVEADEADGRKRLDRREVAGGHGLPVGAQEGLPRGALGTYRRGVETMGFEKRGDGRAADVMAEVAERVADACVAPAGVFSCHAHEKRLNLAGGLRASERAFGAAVVLLGDEVAISAQDRVGRDDAGVLAEQLATEGFALDCEATALRIGEAKASIAELLAEGAVLGLEILDELALLAVDPAGDGDPEDVDGIHGPRDLSMRPSIRHGCDSIETSGIQGKSLT